jgi:RNA polymerase sigma-70 factor, ECF subfamily
MLATAWRRSTRGEGWASGARRARFPVVEATDTVLAARLTAGDESALAEVFDALGPTLLATALRVVGERSLAEDVVQDVFVDLWRRPHRFEPALGTLRTYLGVLTQHRALDLVRSEVRRAGREERFNRLTPTVCEPMPGDELDGAATAGILRDALQSLSPEQRRAVELAYFQGLTYREVAHALGIPEGTAKSRLRLALAKLETILDHELLEPSS